MSFLSELGGHFESSCSATPQWNSFYRKAVNFFRNSLKDVATNVEMHKGHFYFSGFFTAKETGKIFYFSISDVRFFPGERMLIRTAKSYKDYTGGPNGYMPIDNRLAERVNELIEHIG